MFDPSVTLPSAFAAGLLSFLSPCVLPVVPTFSAVLTGSGAANGGRQSSFWLNAGCFLGGFTLVFVVMGATASFFGQLLIENQRLIQKIGACFMVLMGLQLSGLFSWRLLQREYRPLLRYQFQGPGGAFLLGIAFTLGWTPCTGPILATILVYAGTADTLWQGAFLLFIYSLGFCLPFIALAALIRRYVLAFDSLYRWLPAIRRAAGVVLIVIGVSIYFDWLQKGLGAFWGAF
ncbi:MAG: cytochrome c biogenesis CcdA family protein [Sporomusaceae bacterium]|nr:cytochrome c biogenesis CcdA family protein [Sporomusaceae bacterium]